MLRFLNSFQVSPPPYPPPSEGEGRWGAIFLFAWMILFGASAWAMGPEDVSRFQQANQAYRDGDLGSAVSAYRELAQKYPESSILQYNLGNTHYRSGSLGAAILAYERALLLSPRDQDILKNLSYVKGLLEYRIEDKRNWYVRAGEAVLKRFRGEEMSFLALASYFLFASAWAYALFFRPGIPWGWWRKTALVLSSVLMLLLAAKGVEMHVMRDAVVMAKEAEIRYGPSEGDQVAFRLGEGLKVYVVDRRKDWSRVMLENGESGWVKNLQIAEVSL